MRRNLKISAWVLGGLVMFSVLLGTAVYIAGNTDTGRALIERLTDRLTSGHVKLTGLTGSFPEELSLEKLELSDDRGIWLTAERLRLQWTPLAYLARRLQIDRLQVAKIDMLRLPVSSAAPDSGTVSIPHIDVARMSVDLLQLGPQLAGVPTSLVLSGSAHLRSVQDMSFDAAAHRINGAGEYALKLKFDSKRMDADLKLHEPAGGPLENLLQLPGLGALAANVNLNGPRAAERLDLSIDAGALRGRAQGVVNLTALSGDFNFDFESPALNPRPDLSWGSATVKGRWHGSVKSPVADGHVDIAKLQLPGGIQIATLNADVGAAAGKATLRALVGGLRIPGSAGQLLQESPLNVDASLQLDDAVRPMDLVVSHRLFSLKARADTAGMDTGKQNASGELRLLNLTPFAAAVGLTIRGSAVATAQIKGDGATTRMVLDAGAALAEGDENWSPLVGNRATLQLSGSLTGAAVQFDSVKFTGRAVTLSASGSAQLSGSAAPASLRMRWQLELPELRVLSAVLAGTAKAGGTIEGPINSLGGEAHVTSTLSVRGSPSGALAADIKVQGLPSAPSGTLVARGTLDGAPLGVDLAVQRGQPGSIHTLIRRVDWKSGHIDGDVSVATATGLASGQLRLQVGQLGDLQHLVGIDVTGSVNGNVMLRAVQGRTHAQYHLQIRDLTAGQFAANVQVTGEGVSEALAYKMDVQVPKFRGSAASAAAAGSLNIEAHDVRIADAVVNYLGQDFRLLAPATVAFGSGVSVDMLRLGAQKAVFQLQGKLSPALDVHATLSNVQPSLVNVFAPGLLQSGTIDARAQLQGSPSAPVGEVRLTATGVRLADDAAFGLPPLDLKAGAQLKRNTADIDARLVAGEASKLSVTGHVPLAFDGALDLKLSGSLDVAMINPLLEARGQHAAGQLAIDATVVGSVAAPEIGGMLTLTKGSVRDYVRGVNVSDIAAEAVGNHGTLQIKRFTATAAPGTLAMTGTVGVLQKGMPVDLKITADNAQPIVSKLVTANLNADLHVSGTAREHLDITGTVHLNRTLIGIPSSLPPNVAVLDVRRRGKAAPAAPEKDLVIGLDVAIQAPQEVLVQGRGLDAEVGGDLHVGGTTESPFVSGEFNLLRGSFSLASNRLNFTDGRVSFNGAGLKNKIDPTLDFTAQTTLPEATAKLRITGYADAPQIEFTSVPVLPPETIMAQLLFGQNISQLSGLQLAQIGAALATLSGVGGDSGLNPLVKLQKSLGLDRLTVGAGGSSNATGTENTGASIEAGRYISKRVYVEAKQTTAGTSQLQAQVDLTKHLKLQTRLGNGTVSAQGTTPENDPGTSIGLLYQFEY